MELFHINPHLLIEMLLHDRTTMSMMYLLFYVMIGIFQFFKTNYYFLDVKRSWLC